MDITNQSFSFMNYFQEHLPTTKIAHLMIPRKGKCVLEPLGLVITTNHTEEELEKAKDTKFVQDVQEKLGVKRPAAWYFYQNP